MADFDADGNDDLITGSFDGGLYLVPGKGGGEFGAPAKVLDPDGDVVRVGQYWNDEARRWFGSDKSSFKSFLGISGFPFDWDADGDFDLLLGTNQGRIFLRRNEGTPEEAKWATDSEALEAGGEPMAVDGHALPVVADWNGDGRFDVITGANDGSVWWYENTGENEPQFAAAQRLVEAASGDADSPGSRPQVAVADFDADGDLDLLLGDYHSAKTEDPKKSVRHGYVWLFRRTSAAAPDK